MDRSVEMRLRLNIADFQRGTREASRDMDSLIARAGLLDAQLDRISASGANAAAGLRDARAQTRGMGRDADRAAPGIMAAQAALDAFNNSAATASNNAASMRRSTTGMSRGMTQAGASARGASSDFDQSGRSINQLTGRIGLAVDAVLTLGSAVIPIGAVAAQAAGGLAAMGAAAVIAGGSVLLAFQGISDAVEAVQKFQDDPTWDNARAAHEELDRMSGSTRQFVMQFQRVRPVLSDIQDAAADGWFPGLTQALGDLDELAPKLEKILLQTGTVGGDLVAQSTESLAGPRWEEFYDFVADEVPTAMAALFRIMGDLGHGAAEMWMAFDPGNDAFIDWVEGVADGFDDWASSAEGREDIADFLAYARESGPQVAAFFSALGDALISIVQAAAPLGGPTLAALTAVFEVIGKIADSDMATPLLAAVAAMRLMSRVQGLVTAGQGRLNAAMVTTTRTTTALTRAQAAALNASGLTGTALGAALAAPRAGDVRRQQQAQRQARLGMGAQAIGVGLLASGAASELELTNTAMLALAGSMAGPVGAALGAVAGLSMDAAAGNDALSDSIEAAGAALKSGDFASGLTALADAQSALSDFQDKVKDGQGAFAGLTDPGAYLANQKNFIEGIFGDSDIDEAAADIAALEQEMLSSQQAVAGLGDAFGMAMGPLDGSARSVQQLEAALAMAKPAMDALGISQEQLTTAFKQQEAIAGGGFMGAGIEAAVGSTTPYDDLTEAIRRKAEAMDSAAGRAENYRAVLHSLATDTGTAADQADRLREALDALTDPALNAEAALSAQRDVLKEISELNADAGFTQKTEVGRENLEITRNYTEAVKERLATMVEAERSEEDVARALQTSREQFIASGVAAGFSREQMTARAKAIGLTPKLVETTFRELGVTEVQRKAWALRDAIKAMPKDQRTKFLAEGVPKTMGEVNALVEKYKLTEKQRQALITLKDQASAGIRNVQGLLNSVNGNRADTYIYTHHVQVNSTRNAGMVAEGSAGTGRARKAAGGLVTGPGGPRDDAITAQLSNREYVQQAAAVAYYGVGLMDALNARLIPRDLISGDLGLPPRFAGGGYVGGRFSMGGVSAGLGPRDVLSMGAGGTRDVMTLGMGLTEHAQQLAALRRLNDAELKQRERALKERQRDLEKDLRLTTKARDQAEKRLADDKAALDKLRDLYDALAEQVAANFRTDVFGGEVDLEQAAKDGLLDREFMQRVQTFVTTKAQEAAERARLDAEAKGASPEEVAAAMAAAARDAFEGDMLSDNIGAYLESLTDAQITALEVLAQEGLLEQDADDAREFERLLEQLTALGLDGGVYAELAASGNIAQAQAYAAMTAGQIDNLEQLYKDRQAALQSVGATAGDAQYGAALQVQTQKFQDQLDETRGLRRDFRENTKALHRVEKRMELVEKAAGTNGPDRVVRGVNAGLKGAVTHGQRSAV